MYLVRWEPRRTVARDAMLYVVGTLKCPHCETVEEVQSGNHLVSDIPRIDGEFTPAMQHTIDCVFGPLLQSRACERCGIVSGVPRLDRERLVEEAQERFTEEWLLKSGAAARRTHQRIRTA